MAREKVRITMSFEESAHDLFLRAGNASSYISRVIQQRWREWQHSLKMLRGHGLSNKAIINCIYALNPSWELYDVAECRAALAKANVKVPALADSDVQALMALCAEWWAGNDELTQTLDQDDAPQRRARPA